jgi:hypothetical protein
MPPEYPVLGSAFSQRMHKIGAQVRCLCCGATHIHVMFDWIEVDAKEEIAAAKQYASLKLETHPGRVFAKDCSVDEVGDIEHARNLFGYILDHEKSEGAWVWRHDRDTVPTREQIAQLLATCKAKLSAK